MQTLTPRQKSIFARIVDEHIETAQPVASKHIARVFNELYRDTYSPATVRHEMGVLETAGFLMHPHTSAGRVPTDRGYRFYVDHSVKVEPKRGAFESHYSGAAVDVDEQADATEKVSQLLSDYSGQVSLVLIPRRKSERLRGRFYLRGTSHLLEKPEFQNIDRLKTIYRKLDQPESLMEWFERKVNSERVSIYIGKESEEEAFEDCSVIASKVKSSHGDEVILAVVGPKRMHYAKTVSLVAQMSVLMRRSLV